MENGNPNDTIDELADVYATAKLREAQEAAGGLYAVKCKDKDGNLQVYTVEAGNLRGARWRVRRRLADEDQEVVSAEKLPKDWNGEIDVPYRV